MSGHPASSELPGREAELGLVDSLLADVEARLDPGVLLVGGDAGIGKSSLVAAIERRGRDRGLVVVKGNCVDVDAGVPFGPVVDALRLLVERRGGAESLPGSARWLMGAGDEPAGEDGLRSLVDATIAMTRGRPTVLVIEDMHWADRSTRDFTRWLSQSSTSGLPLLVLTFRLDDLHDRHPLRRTLAEMRLRPGCRTLTLGPLDQAAVASIIEARTGRRPDADTVTSLWSRCEGNPLYLNELLASPGGVPATLGDLLRRHVRGLSGAAAALMRLASVGGSQVDVDVVREASGSSDAVGVDRLFREALEGNVLRRDGDRLAFRHALLRDVVYQGLLPSERVRLHSAFIDVLRRRAETGSTFDRWRANEGVAFHASAADEPTAQFAALFEAGRAALSFGARNEAADDFERALDLWDRVDEPRAVTGLEASDLARLAAEALESMNRYDKMAELARRAVGLVDRDGDPLAASRAYRSVALLPRQPADLIDQSEALRRAVDLAEPGPCAELADALTARASFSTERGRFAAALSDASRAADVSAELGYVAGRQRSQFLVGNAQWWLGRCEQGAETYRTAVRIARRGPDLGAILEDTSDFAWLLILAGRFSEGVALSRSGRAEANRVGLGRVAALCGEQEAVWLIWQGEFAEAEQLTEQLHREGLLEYRWHWLAAELALARGDVDGAIELEHRPLLVDTDAESLPAPEIAIRQTAMFEAAGDAQRAIGTAQHLVDRAQGTDSPLIAAAAAGSAFQALAAFGATTVGSPGLVRAAHEHLTFAREGRTDGWDGTWFGMQLAIATAYALQLEGQPALPQWEHAVRRATPFGLYAALRPRLEYARECLRQHDRDTGRDELVALWRDARIIDATWFERRAAQEARKSRVPLPNPADADAPGPWDRLTMREREVLDLVATGATNRDIGRVLHITEKTASVHVGSVLAKLGVPTRGAAASLLRQARDHGQRT